MKYILNKNLIIEGVLSSANASFLSGSSHDGETIHQAASNYIKSNAETKHQQYTEKAIQDASGGELVNSLERAKLSQHTIM